MPCSLQFLLHVYKVPDHFCTGDSRVGRLLKLGSSLIVMSIVGGAIAPPFMGHIADLHSMRTRLCRAPCLFCFRHFLRLNLGQARRLDFLDNFFRAPRTSIGDKRPAWFE